MLDVKAIVEDGKVDAEETAQILKEFLGDDGRIDEDEIRQVFEINDGVSGNPDNDPSWKRAFVFLGGCFCLNDEATPNVVDEGEADVLIELIGADGKVDDNEKALLEHVLRETKSVPQKLKDYAQNAGVAV